MQIFKMKPVYKDYLWGGNKLKSEYGKDTPYERTAESWEIAFHKNGESQVAGGIDDGKTLSEIIKIYKEKLLGDKIYKGEETKFPLLVKLIDAKDNLSIQVHPDDEYAKTNEGGEYGKTEMWYVLEAEKGAGLICGFKKDITKAEFIKSIKNNTLIDYVNFIECKKGDYFFIPSGMLHAIGKGLLIAEIQQSSDTTYRVYDYERRDSSGKARELHINKAIDVVNFKKTPLPKNIIKEGVLVTCPYFTTEKLVVKENVDVVVDKESFEIFIVCDGAVTINDKNYKKGDTLLIPAYIGSVHIEGDAVILRIFIMNGGKI